MNEGKVSSLTFDCVSDKRNAENGLEEKQISMDINIEGIKGGSLRL